MSQQPQLLLVTGSTRPPAPVSGAADARAAAAGDGRAWESLVRRYTPVLRATARGFGLSPADVDDVVQTTWLAALVHIRRLRNPEAIGGWLVTTARRAAMRTPQRFFRELLTDTVPEAAAPYGEQPEERLIERERRSVLETALERLPARQRVLLGALLAEDEPSYAAVSGRLQMPIGSVGPTRERALARLRDDRALAGLHGHVAA